MPSRCNGAAASHAMEKISSAVSSNMIGIPVRALLRLSTCSFLVVKIAMMRWDLTNNEPMSRLYPNPSTIGYARQESSVVIESRNVAMKHSSTPEQRVIRKKYEEALITRASEWKERITMKETITIMQI